MSLGCNYEAPTFGARYPDGTCVDGWMWDLDSCDEPGGSLMDGGDQPCPFCNTVEFIEWCGPVFSGSAHQRRVARRREIKRVREWAERRSSFPPISSKEAP
jgi:RNA polymerase subunit RPABC4/transcription elongation factor Spt4